ncbi:bifunctional CRAL-TRIO lipid binding domain superfamily/CRAL-TRIO lipid binding domain/CRAL-TRIO [Babesia duncani]|uniref:Bifunctional CRAL-TRIO lipid binding domain superfamily/CRAL-TRIO lipid binding domain/CRAL-TRIO n=1 Tax=Babesia duncani TaxID=323732 RepID=A0AAD9PNC4_9APIC|nr:bifunctional CRAL-TRIO lipid binding domain superfamily/CRAL-TRIO lipid binding domain/CRAL-TRIO [Babesia duncani]
MTTGDFIQGLDEGDESECGDFLGDLLQLPEIVKSYVPGPNMFTGVTKGGHRFRYIFSNVPLTEFELEHIRAFKVYAIQRLDGGQVDANMVEESFSSRFGATVFSDDSYLLRYIIGNYYNYPDVFVDIREHLKWRKATLPVRRSEVEAVLAQGIIYIHGRDRCMRPILVLRIGPVGNMKHDHVLKAIFFTLELAIAKLMIPGRIEQWRVLLDLTGVKLYSIPVTLLKQIAKGLTVNYRGRLSQMFIVNAPYIITGIWNMVKTVLPQVTQDKISISSGKSTSKILECCDPSQIEVRYGGSAPNATSFDLPIMPDM